MSHEPNANDFGEAESLILDGSEVPDGVEPPAARGSQRTPPSSEDYKIDETDEFMDADQPPPRRNVARIVLLTLIPLVTVGLVGNSVWHKYFAPPPIPESASPSFPSVNHLPNNKPMASAPQTEAIGSLGGGGVGVIGGVDSGTAQKQPTPQSSASSAPQPTQLSSTSPQQLYQGQQASPAPAAIAQTKAASPNQPAKLSPSTKSISPISNTPNTTASPAPTAKASAPEESIEAKVERLEKEVRSLKALAKSGGQGGRVTKEVHSKKAGEGATSHKVVGMSATSVWVRQSNGKTAELKVGDHFKNGEVIQSIDQQSQVVETDRGRYKVSF